MIEYLLRYFPVFVILMAALTFPPKAGIAANDPMALPPARKIPGLTADDEFPGGCVDCHINMPDIQQDERISVSMLKWNKSVEPELLEKAQSVTIAGIRLKGVHPPATESLRDIPAACIMCHSINSAKAPPFAALLHAIHLTGGDDNHFLTIFQGECTYCHKMNVETGVWTVPSGPEK